MDDETKSGARNNASDREMIRKIRAALAEVVELTRGLEPNDEDPQSLEEMVDGMLNPEKTLIAWGGSVKAERVQTGVKVGGYLTRFGGVDLQGEYFDSDTDFDLPEQVGVYFHHGQDSKVGKRRLSRAQLTQDDVGVWAETILQERDDYEKFIAEMALAGKLGWSSGTIGHLMDREPQEDGRVKITQWPIAEASLTHTPAEPRNMVMPLKSLIPDTTEALDGSASLPVEETLITTKSLEVKMELTAELLEEMMIKTAAKAVEEFRKSEPATEKAGVVTVTKDAGDQPFESTGQYFQAIKNAALYPSAQDVRLNQYKAATGLGENVPADGGYLLAPTVAGGIVERMYANGNILNRVAKDQVGPNSNSMVYNGIDETSRVDGSRWGGILGYWLSEGGTKTASAPKFRQVELKLHKVAALAYATDELLSDATALQGWLGRTVPEELRFRVEDAIYNGDGVGKPLGIMNSPALITMARDTATTVLLADIVGMWARRWAGARDYCWYVNQDVMPKLMTLSNTYQALWMTSVVGGQPATLMGAPVFEIEQAASLNTTGDIMLAAMSQYQTIEKGGIQAASSIHVQFLTDQTCFRFVYRVDGSPIWHSPLTPFKGSNTQSPFIVLGSANA